MMDRKIEGRATSDMKLLATAWPIPNSDMIEDITGGTACMEAKNEKEARKEMASINRPFP